MKQNQVTTRYPSTAETRRRKGNRVLRRIQQLTTSQVRKVAKLIASTKKEIPDLSDLLRSSYLDASSKNEATVALGQGLELFLEEFYGM
jgi:hypothetical protein